MMTAEINHTPPRLKNTSGFSLLEVLLSTTIIAFVLTASIAVILQMRLQNAAVDAKLYAQSLALEALENRWNQPLAALTNAPMNWTTNGSFDNIPITVTITSEIKSNAVEFTAQSHGFVVNNAFTNRFFGTRIY